MHTLTEHEQLEAQLELALTHGDTESALDWEARLEAIDSAHPTG